MKLVKLTPDLVHSAVAWAQAEAASGQRIGVELPPAEQALARQIGVAHPQHVRVVVGAIPAPRDPVLAKAAKGSGLPVWTAAGLTLGYTIFIRPGCLTPCLLAHEFRHVFQYEQNGGIKKFLPMYLEQIVAFGYENAPFEMEARAHEQLAY